MTPKHLKGAALGMLTILCWSGYNVAAKHGIDTGISPEALAFLRFSVPGFLAIPCWIALRAKGARVNLGFARLAVLVLLGGPVFGVIAVSGYAHAPLSHGLLFAPVAVFVTSTVLGALYLNERLSPGRIAGAFIMFLGLAILVGFEMRTLGHTWAQGVACFGLAGVMWGGYTVLLRVWNVPMITGSLAVATGSTLVVMPLLGPGAVSALTHASFFDLMLQLVMQGVVGGVISVAALIGAVRMLPTYTVALLPVFTPIAALALAAILLGQQPSQAEIAGVNIIAAGFLLSIWWTSRTPAKSTQPHLLQGPGHNGKHVPRGLR